MSLDKISYTKPLPDKTPGQVRRTGERGVIAAIKAPDCRAESRVRAIKYRRIKFVITLGCRFMA